MTIPPDDTNLQSTGLPLGQVDSTGESRDEPSSTSNEKSTQTNQPHVDEECVSDEEPKSVNTVADVAMDDAEKMLRNPSTDRADSKGLQDLAKEDHEAENELGGCHKEADPGRMAHQSEPHPLPAKQVERNDCKELSVCDGSKKTPPLVKKRLITVEGNTYFVSRGMEKKFGFEKTKQTER